MTYLIIHPGHPPFYTNWFEVENNYVEGMTVINLLSGTYYNGKEWEQIEEDHL